MDATRYAGVRDESTPVSAMFSPLVTASNSPWDTLMQFGPRELAKNRRQFCKRTKCPARPAPRAPSPAAVNHQADCFIGNAEYFSVKSPLDYQGRRFPSLCGRNKSLSLLHPLLLLLLLPVPPPPQRPLSFSPSRGSRVGRLSWRKSQKEAEVLGSHRQILSISPVAYLHPLAFSFFPLSRVPLFPPSCLVHPSFFAHSLPLRSPLLVLLFTAARFYAKTGRTRSKGYRVWRCGRPERGGSRGGSWGTALCETALRFRATGR